MSSSCKVLSAVLVTKVSGVCALVITNTKYNIKTFIECFTPSQVNMADPVIYKRSLTVLNIFLLIAATALVFSGLVLMSVYHMAKVNIALVPISLVKLSVFSWSSGLGIFMPPLSVC